LIGVTTEAWAARTPAAEAVETILVVAETGEIRRAEAAVVDTTDVTTDAEVTFLASALALERMKNSTLAD